MTQMPLVHTEEVTGSVLVSTTQLDGRFRTMDRPFSIFRKQQSARKGYDLHTTSTEFPSDLHAAYSGSGYVFSPLHLVAGSGSFALGTVWSVGTGGGRVNGLGERSHAEIDGNRRSTGC
jgi:hypothetical protein